MTDDDLTKLEALAQAATPGPWWAKHTKSVWLPSGRSEHEMRAAETGETVAAIADNINDHGPESDRRDADCSFIAAAREAVPALVAEVRWRRAEIERQREALTAAHTDLARLVDRNNRPCTHVTLRPGHLPCPHPECWTGPQRVYFLDPAPPATAYYRSSGADLSNAPRLTGAWHMRTVARVAMFLGEREVWGWFPE